MLYRITISILLAIAFALLSVGVYEVWIEGKDTTVLDQTVTKEVTRYDTSGGKSDPAVGAPAVNTVGGQVYTLDASGVTASASSIDLNSFTLPQTGQKLNMSDFGDIGYGTLEPGNDDRQEFISWTGVTQNGDGSATLTGVTRGLSPVSPYTASSTLQFAHSGGTRFIISNPPQLFDQVTFKGNDETITGTYTFSSTSQPRYDGASTLTGNPRFLASVNYVDNTTNQGAATSTETNAGISELATQTEMASSTDLGADNPLVLQAKYSTSSPGTNDIWNVVTRNSGKIAQGFLDLTEKFSFTGGVDVTGGFTADSSTTTNATSTNSLAVTGAFDASGASSISGVAKNASTTTFTTNDTYNKSTGVKLILVELWGAGGGGGNGENGNDSGENGGGGGGGGYYYQLFDPSEVGSSVSITIGSGGTGGATGGDNGAAGGNTTFGSIMTAFGGGGGASSGGGASNDSGGGGGGGGINAQGGTGATGGSGGSGGGFGGGSSGSDPSSITAGAGGAGSGSNTGAESYYGGGGGGSGSNAGGASFYGGAGGGGGNGGSGGTSTHGGNGGSGGGDGVAGSNGTAPAGGGGGGGWNSGADGGDGARGQARITEFF